MGSILGNRVTRVEDPRFLTTGGNYVDDISLARCGARGVRPLAVCPRNDPVDRHRRRARGRRAFSRIFTAADLTERGADPAARPGHARGDGRRSSWRPTASATSARPSWRSSPRPRRGGRRRRSRLRRLRRAPGRHRRRGVGAPTRPVVPRGRHERGDGARLASDVPTSPAARSWSRSGSSTSGCRERRWSRGSAPPTGPTRAAWSTTRRARGPTRPRRCWRRSTRLDPAIGAGGRARHGRWLRRQVPHLPGGGGARLLRQGARPPGASGPRPAARTSSPCRRVAARCSTRRSAVHATGRITAYQLDVFQDAGAYPMTGSVLHGMTMRMACGVYDIANVGFTGTSWVTNTASITAYRGAGRPEAAVAIERMVDRFAAEIGMDPAEVRRINMIPKFTETITTGIGTPVRRRRLPAVARARARGGRLRRAARRAAAPPRRRTTRCSSASASPPTSRSPRVWWVRVRRGRAPARRLARRAHRRDPLRPGPRHDLGDDRRRPHRRADRPHPRASTATPTRSAPVG